MTDAYLFYVVGRSGVGKDTVLEHLRHTAGCTVAHRYITRKADAGNENHIELSEEEFSQRLNLGAFALSWQAHGNAYGIGIEVKHWLDMGLSVFVNGSRHHLAAARECFGKQMISVLIEADDETCRARLARRSRETNDEIEQRMKRDVIEPELFDWRIDNSGTLNTTLRVIEGKFAKLKGARDENYLFGNR